MDRPTITVKYSCPLCGAKDEEVAVPARLDPEAISVVDYFQKVVMKAVARHHIFRDLLCEATTLQDLKIPIDKDDPEGWIGKPLPPGKGWGDCEIQRGPTDGP